MPSFPKPTPRPKRRLARGSTLPAPKAPIAAFSARRRALYDDHYLPQRKRFLAEHPRCQLRITGICSHEATQVHHLIQRSLDPSDTNLLDEVNWRASCEPCNNWISDHSVEARANGWEIDPKTVNRKGGGE